MAPDPVDEPVEDVEATTPVPAFSAAVRADGAVELAGELSLAELGALRAALDEALAAEGDLLRVDAERLTFIDTTAISELLRYQLLAAAERRLLCVERPSPFVTMVLDLLDLQHLLAASDEDAAPTAPTAVPSSA